MLLLSLMVQKSQSALDILMTVFGHVKVLIPSFTLLFFPIPHPTALRSVSSRLFALNLYQSLK